MHVVLLNKHGRMPLCLINQPETGAVTSFIAELLMPRSQVVTANGHPQESPLTDIPFRS